VIVAFYELPASTFDELLRRAEKTLDRRSTSYVADAMAYARWLTTTGKALVEEVADLQQRLAKAEAKCK
jgi:hypothetical protein